MQTAPSASFVQPSAVPLADLRPGQPFAASQDLLNVYALLSHEQIDVADATRRWCVVIAAQRESAHVVGAMLPLSASRSVYPLTLRSPAQYSAV